MQIFIYNKIKSAGVWRHILQSCPALPNPVKFPTENYQKCISISIYIWYGAWSSGVGGLSRTPKSYIEIYRLWKPNDKLYRTIKNYKGLQEL